jgi:acetyl esterase/lipase
MIAVALAFPGTSGAPVEEAIYDRATDVIYGRKYGLALTMDVFAPKKHPNGIGLIYVVSGGWFSSPDMIRPNIFVPFLKHGYTVFAVVHGSPPRFTIPETVDDIHRAVRFVRAEARRYRIDPRRIGIVGSSAGGHLALMLGTTGTSGKPVAKDLVDRESSQVQAVACFFPHTDFLNWGKEGGVLSSRTIDSRFKAALDFHEFDPVRNVFVRIEDDEKVRVILRTISPVAHVTRDSAPTLLIHGDSDPVVPLQQSERILAKFKESGVPASMLVKKGGKHGWQEWGDIRPYLDQCVAWFDTYLIERRTNKMSGRAFSCGSTMSIQTIANYWPDSLRIPSPITGTSYATGAWLASGVSPGDWRTRVVLPR